MWPPQVRSSSPSTVERQGAGRAAVIAAASGPVESTLGPLALEGTATVIDECVALHDRILGKLCNAARNRHQQQFQQAGQAINDKVRLYPLE